MIGKDGVGSLGGKGRGDERDGGNAEGEEAAASARVKIERHRLLYGTCAVEGKVASHEN